MNAACPYCGAAPVLVTGDEIYPHRLDLYGLMFWLCRPCNAYTGTHINSKNHAPKGRLADAELRAAKIKAHAAFDPLWKDGKMSRKQAYKWLQDRLNMTMQPHIGWMDIDGCNQVSLACSTLLTSK